MSQIINQTLTLFICFSYSVIYVYSVEIMTIGGMWNLANSNKSVKVTARIPGSVYTDLIQAGILSDPYNRFNDENYRWVSYEDWSFTKTFYVADTLLQYSVIELLCDGLDTVAAVNLNGHHVALTSNKFRRYVFPIKHLLLEGDNSLEVVFMSPVLYSKWQADMYPYTVPPECPPNGQHGECYFNFIRKDACSFSWDWGPAFPTMGIWKNISLVAYNYATIAYITTDTTPGVGGSWGLSGSVYFRHAAALFQDGSVSGMLDVVVPKLGSWKFKCRLSSTQDFCSFSVEIAKSTGVSLWWPHGHGEPILYDLNVIFTPEDRQETVKEQIRIGFRTVELIQEPIRGSDGLSFYFKINGAPIFMKGSNWIPADAFQERVTREYLKRLLQSTVEANMNMLRVWGGGVYESEEFYDLADELGIMIWQDFMFACAMYPSNQAFLQTAHQEALHQVRRLKHRPSIAVWAGNNENEWGLAPYRKDPSFKLYYADYVRLYVDTLRAVVLSEDQSRPFVSSSPSNGLETEVEGWVARNPQDPLFGDVHHYDYSSNSWDWHNYPVPRFASEFGLQSWCSLETLEPVSIAEDWFPDSKFCQQRQHHPDGNKQLTLEYRMHFNPPNSSDPKRKFSNFIYLTQINQAMGIKTEAELYRRSQSEVTDGKGKTMGALYWQLNDIWQAPTWASLEYGGKWKMLHYYAKRFYNQTLISPYLDGDLVRVYYVKDRAGSSMATLLSPDGLTSNVPNKEQLVAAQPAKHVPIRNQYKNDMNKTLDLYLSCYSWSSLKPRKVWTSSFIKPHHAAGLVYEEKLSGLLEQCACGKPQHCLLYFSLDKHDSSSTNWLLLSDFRTEVGLKKPDILIEDVKLLDNVTASVTITTKAFAPFVWLEATGYSGRFSDNGFLLVHSKTVLLYYCWSPIQSASNFRDSLTVRSLVDIYQ